MAALRTDATTLTVWCEPNRSKGKPHPRREKHVRPLNSSRAGWAKGMKSSLLNATHMILAGGTILAFGALGGCTDVPSCRYWSDAHIGRNMDPSQLPMLPNNPFWLAKVSPASDDPCAGEPPPSTVRG
jgi:hypothetical protein